MTLFLSHINCSTTKTIQNIFINLRAIKVGVILLLNNRELFGRTSKPNNKELFGKGFER